LYDRKGILPIKNLYQLFQRLSLGTGEEREQATPVNSGSPGKWQLKWRW